MEESVAIHLIKKAVQFDADKRYAEALVCYTEGIELLLGALKNIQDEKKKAAFRVKISSYFERAEALKKLIEEIKISGKYHEQLQIEENSTGNSYEKLFSRFFNDETVESIHIVDPYVRARHQIHQFLRFCDMAVKLSKNLKKITLVTSNDESSKQDQIQKLTEIQTSLSKRNIALDLKYDPLIHDREIRLNNGWIIKIGRGLDFFKSPESRDSLCIGFHDLDLRPCYATTIDIFHESSCNFK